MTVTNTENDKNLEFLHGAFEKPQLIAVGGRPSSGKSLFGADILRTVAIDLGKTALMFSLEETAQEVASSVIALQSGLSRSNLKTGNLQPDDVQELHKAMEAIANSNMLIEEVKEPSLERMKERIVAQKNSVDGLSVVLIDYLQLMSVSKNVSANRQEAIDDIIQGFKSIVLEYGVTIIIFSQLSREVEKREDKTPTLIDLRNAKVIYTADSCILLHRPSLYDADAPKSEVFAIVAKNRYGTTGTYKIKAA